VDQLDHWARHNHEKADYDAGHLTEPGYIPMVNDYDAAKSLLIIKSFLRVFVLNDQRDNPATTPTARTGGGALVDDERQEGEGGVRETKDGNI
jgi:hypothetical protein